MQKLLTQAQAEGAYSAMVALNNVGGVCRMLGIGRMRLSTNADTGSITIIDTFSKEYETYSDQMEFANSYKLGDLY